MIVPRLVVLFVSTTCTLFAFAWAPGTSLLTSQHHSRCRAHPPSCRWAVEPNENDMEEQISWPARRDLMTSTAVLAAVVLGSTNIALAADNEPATPPEDPLEAFGKALQQEPRIPTTPWPQSTSPLPHSPPPPDDSPTSDMEKALMDAQKKNQIDPRTHG